MKTISTNVKLKTKGHRRSPKWAGVRKKFLRMNPRCACCGSKKKVEVHHIKSFYNFPELELDPKNLITLCEGKKIMNCHICIGHTGNYQDTNPRVIEDAGYWYNLFTTWQTPKFERVK